MTDMRCRTTFYIALGRLLMVDLGEDEERFEQFMMPLAGMCKTSLMNSFYDILYIFCYFLDCFEEKVKLLLSLDCHRRVKTLM